METFVCEGKDFKFNSRFHFKPIKKKKEKKLIWQKHETSIYFHWL